jgi:predicted dehydrogenase
MNRRQILQASAFAGTWSLLSPLARALGANDVVRVAVIGFNGRGNGHIDDLLRVKGCRIVALCDCDSTVLAKGKERLEKKGIKVDTFTDYRKLCESKDIDAVSIATPNHTHVLIALTAAANGKHVYVEKPVSHNVWEGRQLALGAEKHKVIIQHGFQRRSETSWAEAFEWLKEGKLGKLEVARGFCYKPRPSIGKADKPLHDPDTVEMDLWYGPREKNPIMRKKLHYDWHWQAAYGNGDLGNQGPHQLDVCRWALGDPHLPEKVVSMGGRVGYDDDGDTANTQLLWLEHKDKAPILFEVRGLPRENMDYGKGMDKYLGQDIGNIIQYEGGYLAGGHNQNCHIHDKDGKIIKSFKGARGHHQNWIDSIKSGKIDPIRGAESAHYSSALAHLGGISLSLGKLQPLDEWVATSKNAMLNESTERMMKHLDANKVDLKGSPLTIGVALDFDPKAEQFTGQLAQQANTFLKGEYRKGFELPA